MKRIFLWVVTVVYALLVTPFIIVGFVCKSISDAFKDGCELNHALRDGISKHMGSDDE